MSSNHPKTERFLRSVLVFVLILIVVTAFGAYRQRRVHSDLEGWRDAARARGLSTRLSLVCDVPGLSDSDLARQFIGRFRVHAWARNETDVETILSLPACPVRLLVMADREVSAQSIERLRDRLGAENVHSQQPEG
jgi:hypothetical protein